MLRSGALKLALVGLLAMVAACSREVPSLKALAPGDVVLAFGDSLTFGTGVEPEDSYPEVLAALIQRSVIRDGVPGETTGAGMLRLSNSLRQHHPKLLLLCLGGNDMLRRVDPAQTEANLRRMIQLARGQGVDVVLIAVPELRLIGGAAPYYERLAEEFGLPLEDATLTRVLKNNEYKSDQIHPNAAGYEMMAQAIAALLKQAGAI